MSTHSSSILPQSIDLLAALRRNDGNITLPGLKGSTAACIIAELLRNQTKNMLVITADQDAADEFRRELAFFSSPDMSPLVFPAWDSQPCSPASPHPDISGARLDTLFRLQNGLARIVILPATAALQRVLPRRTFNEASCYLVAGEDFERDDLLARLVKMGYANVPLVEDRGSFAVRGGILDIFPPNLAAPVRIEFFGDTVETVRAFDPLTQRSLQPVEELVLLPSREILLTDEVLADIAPRLKQCCDDLDIGADRRRGILADLQNSVYFHGVEYLQPLLHPGLETIFDYAPGCLLVMLDPEAIRSATAGFSDEIVAGVAKGRSAALPHSPPGELFLNEEDFNTVVAGHSRLELSGLTLDGGTTATCISIPCRDNSDLRVTVSKETTHALTPLSRNLREWLDAGQRVMVVCHQRPQAERLKELLAPYGIPCEINESSFVETIGSLSLPPAAGGREGGA